MGCDPAEAVMNLVLEEKGRVDEVNFGMCEEDIEYIMKQPYVMTGSDGKAVPLAYAAGRIRDFSEHSRVSSAITVWNASFSLWKPPSIR